MKYKLILVLALICAGAIQALAGPNFPAKAVDYDLMISGGFSIDFDSPSTQDYCALGGTGHMAFTRKNVDLTQPMPHTIPIELTELELESVHPDVQFKMTHAATPPSTGRVLGGAAGDFPADSFFDVFIEVQLAQPGGGTLTLINKTPIQLKGMSGFERPAELASFFDVFVELQPVDLFDKQNQAVRVGTMPACWFATAKKGTEAKHGVSINISGQEQLGPLSYTICDDKNNTVHRAAVVDVKGSRLAGLISSNADCDEVFKDLGLTFPQNTTLQFIATWDRDLRIPDWRGNHVGKFQIVAVPPSTPAGQPKPIVIAQGKMCGTHGVGTHRPPLPAPHDGEDCDDCSHFEGQLMAAVIVAGKYKGRLEATYAGVYLQPGTTQPLVCCPGQCIPPHGPFAMTLDGVAITRCLPRTP